MHNSNHTELKNRINSSSQHTPVVQLILCLTGIWPLQFTNLLTLWFPFAEPLPGSKSDAWVMNISCDWVVRACHCLAITLSVRWNEPNLRCNWQKCSVETGSHSHFTSTDFHLIWIFQNIDYICLFLGCSLTLNMKVPLPLLLDTGRKVKT
jgi:hypothetical protein